MQVAQQIVLLLHLMGFAGLLGGVLVQVRTSDPEVSATMLWGGWVLLGTGIALTVLEVVGNDVADWAPLVVKLLLTLFLVLLLSRNRRYLSVPRGLWALIGVLTLVSAVIAVLWPSGAGQ